MDLLHPFHLYLKPHVNLKDTDKDNGEGRSSRDSNIFCVCCITCCCCCILAVSLVISSAFSLTWLSRRRSCFLRAGSDSEARSTGRLRSRIWAHRSSFCFCRRLTSAWLSCRHPHNTGVSHFKTFHSHAPLQISSLSTGQCSILEVGTG